MPGVLRHARVPTLIVRQAYGSSSSSSIAPRFGIRTDSSCTGMGPTSPFRTIRQMAMERRPQPTNIYRAKATQPAGSPIAGAFVGYCKPWCERHRQDSYRSSNITTCSEGSKQRQKYAATEGAIGRILELRRTNHDRFSIVPIGRHGWPQLICSKQPLCSPSNNVPARPKNARKPPS